MLPKEIHWTNGNRSDDAKFSNRKIQLCKIHRNVIKIIIQSLKFNNVCQKLSIRSSSLTTEKL